MFIGYSPATLWHNIEKQTTEIESEVKWLGFYCTTKEIGCVEDCVRNIMESCTAIIENLENLKGEEK